MLKKYYTRCHWAKYVPGIPTAVKFVMQDALGRSLDKLVAELVTDAIDQMTGTGGDDEDHAPAWYKRLGSSARRVVALPRGTNGLVTADAAPEEKEEASHEIEIMEVREWIQPLEVEMELDGVHLLKVERQGELCGICDEHEGENLSFAGCGVGQSAFSPGDEDLSFEGCGVGQSAFSVEV